MKISKLIYSAPLLLSMIFLSCEEVKNEDQLTNCDRVPLFVAVGSEGQVISDDEGVFLCGRSQGELDEKKQLASMNFEEEKAKALADFEANKPAFLVDFENLTELDGLFDFGAIFSIVDNPQVDEVMNSSSKVVKVDRGPGGFQGGGFNLPTPIDLTGENKIVMFKVFSEKALKVSLDFKAGLDGARSANAKADHAGSGWQELSFDYSMATKAFEPDDPENFSALPADEVGVYAQIVFIVGEAGEDEGIYYVDDLKVQ